VDNFVDNFVNNLCVLSHKTNLRNVQFIRILDWLLSVA